MMQINFDTEVQQCAVGDTTWIRPSPEQTLRSFQNIYVAAECARDDGVIDILEVIPEGQMVGSFLIKRLT